MHYIVIFFRKMSGSLADLADLRFSLLNFEWLFQSRYAILSADGKFLRIFPKLAEKRRWIPSMEFFRNFSSNTLAGSGNQSFFLPEDADTVYTGRIFYRIFAGGSNRYSFLFSNIVDSTFSDGSHSHMNLLCDQWRVVRAAAGVCRSCTAETMARVEYFQPLTFSGAAGKEVMPGEFFSSDPVTLDLDRGDYICLELSFQGSMIPCHEESILPAFVLTGDSWKPSKHLPFAGMVGCDRNTALRIGFLGDSITQGIGTEPNSYDHWNAKLAEMLGEKYACWNLGLGFGRAEDAASDGAWLFKGKADRRGSSLLWRK